LAAGTPTPARLAAQTLAIGANSAHPDDAWKFVMFHPSDPAQVRFAEPA